MTTRLSAASSRKLGAQRFASALRAAMRRKRVGQVRLGAAARVSASAISQYRNAHNVPTVEVAARLADVLDAAVLVTLARSARSVSCDNCGRIFTVEAGSPAHYCTETCRRVAQKKRVGSPERTRLRAIAAERQLGLHQECVARMCKSCEPSGLCRDIDCALRVVSPFPMATKERSDTGLVMARKVTDLTGILASNARRWTPEARAAQAERMRRRHAAMTPEERAEFARRVSLGRRKEAA